jgi:hypothetical protein
MVLLKDLGKNASYSNVIAKARSLVKDFRMSSVATEKLLDKCGKTLVVDCTTRWNSVYLMVSRLIEVKPAVNEVLEEMGRDSLLFNEWTRLGELASLLEPFKQQTDNMQTDTLVLSNVIPSLMELSLHLKQSTLPKSLTLPVLQSLQTRFACCLNPLIDGFDPLAAVACYLDPTVSAVMFREDTTQLKEAAKNHILKMVLCNIFAL